MLTGQIQPFFFVGQCFDIHFLKDDRILKDVLLK
jgi:hypothetical protein